MTGNTRTVEHYMAAFARGDHAGVMACLTDDVEWEVPGAFRLTGKAAFDAEIENPAFIGHPDIATTRTVEDGDIVVAEGTVRTQRKDGVHDAAVLRRVRDAGRQDRPPHQLSDGSEVARHTDDRTPKTSHGYSEGLLSPSRRGPDWNDQSVPTRGLTPMGREQAELTAQRLSSVQAGVIPTRAISRPRH